MAGREPRMTDFEERDYYQAPQRRSEVDFREFDSRQRVMTRSPPPRERERDRVPHFLREDPRQTESGQMVLRQRDVETWDRHRHSPSPVRVKEQTLVRRPRSVSPPRRRARSPSVERRRSPSPRPIRYVNRPSSPSPQTRERIRTRIIDRERERSSSSSSSSSEEIRRPEPPPPPPQHIRGPTIEREVITHYRDIDHGTIHARQPSPAPAPKPRPQPRHQHKHREEERSRETDIDISVSKNRTDVDIYRKESRSKSRHRHHDNDLVVYDDSSRRRARSEAPPYRQDEEGREIVNKIDSRGYPGEAWHGATKNWEIVDVPPGTERVRMDGIGGGSTDTQWSKYSGVRRTQFIPERDERPAPAPKPRPRSRSRDDRKSSTSLGSWDREREIEVDIDRTVSRAPPAPPAPAPKEMWTEISKDLVLKEAIQQMGYEYEDTPMYFYVMSYLRYDDVLQLVELSDEIKRYRKDRVREIQYERDWRDDWDRRHRHHHRPDHWDNERVREREVIYDSRRPYYR